MAERNEKMKDSNREISEETEKIDRRLFEFATYIAGRQATSKFGTEMRYLR